MRKRSLRFVDTAILVIYLGMVLIAGSRTGRSQGRTLAPNFPSEALLQSNGDAERDQLLHQMELQRAKKKQRQLIKDTDKLLQLATALNDEVGKTGKGTSTSAIRKADEIERLAKSIRAKMNERVF